MEFVNVFERILESFGECGFNFIVLVDFNVNTFNNRHCLKELFEVSGVRNVVKGPTCYKSKNPTCIDLVVTNVHKRIQNVTNIDTGLSDFHHMICFSTKMHVPARKKQQITYRSYKMFNINDYECDLSAAPFHVAEMFDNVDDVHWFTSKLLKNIIDVHAPLKEKVIKHKQVPYMNSKLRKAINVRNAFNRKFKKCNSSLNWERYRKQRNYVTKLRRNSLLQYMKNRCKSGIDSDATNGDFWRIVKPVISDNCKTDTNVILLENDTIVNDCSSVANILNDYFVHVADDIGQPDDIVETDTFESIISEHQEHESVKNICNNTNSGYQNTFSFHEVSFETVQRKLKGINVKKATGHDQIPPKLIKLGADHLSAPLQYLINMTIRSSCFPTDLKAAEVTPIYKKEDRLNKSNYRPVSVLPCISKICESIYCDQLVEYFDDLFCSNLSGFRKTYNCQHVLLRFIENCKNALDGNKVYGALLTDLSKAFDCLPPKLLVSKLNAYGVDPNSCMLIANYFVNRKQRVKLSHNKSNWMDISKGAPQGSLLGPLLYNIHSNDLLSCLLGTCDVYNYADDNTVGCTGATTNDVQSKLELVASKMLSWFGNNFMKANPNKFQYIIFDRSIKNDDDHVINIGSEQIPSNKCVKLLGVNIDNKLTFNDHISDLCCKAGRKLNVLARLSVILDREAKMLLFNSFIVSQFSFCPIVWNYCKRSDKEKMEKIQYRALKYVHRDFTASYRNLRQRSNVPLLHINRLRNITCEVFKTVNKLNPRYLHDLFECIDHEYNTRGTKLKIPNVKTVKCGQQTFSYQGAILWNVLTEEFKTCTSFKYFKRMVSEWQGPICNCSYCDICFLNQI